MASKSIWRVCTLPTSTFETKLDNSFKFYATSGCSIFWAKADTVCGRMKPKSHRIDGSVIV
jgi:hypothetical protein